MDIKFKLAPELDKVLTDLANSDQEVTKGIDEIVKKGAIQLNVDAKMANPQDTGTSRRAWTAPRKLMDMFYAIENRIEYVPFINYGKKKKSKYAGTPKGVVITPGKNFMEVVTEAYENLSEEIEKQTIKFLKTLKLVRLS